MNFEEYLNQTYGGGAKSTTSQNDNQSFEAYLNSHYGRQTEGAEKPVNSVSNKRLDVPMANSSPITKVAQIGANINTSPKADDIVSKYEKIPSYSFLDREFDKYHADAYNRKQAMLPEYEEAKKQQTEDMISRYGIDINEMQRLYNLGNSRNTDLAMREYLKQKGVTNADDVKAIQNYVRVAKQNQTDKNLTTLADNHPAVATAVSVPLNLASGVTGTLENVGNYLSGNPLSNTSESNAMSRTVGNMRGEVSKDMSGVGSLLYGAGTSALDMGASMLTGGPIGLASEKAQNVMTEGIDRGLTPSQIINEGIASGVTTYITEKIPMGKIEKLAETGFKGVGKELAKNIVKTVGATMASEGLQEMSEDLADTLADRIIAGDKNKLKVEYDNYIANGISKGEAAKRVFGNYVQEVLIDGLAGAITGGALGTLGGINGSIASRNNPQIPTLDPNVEAQKIDFNGGEYNGQTLLDGDAIRAREQRISEENYANANPENDLSVLMNQFNEEQARVKAEEAETASRRAKLDEDFRAFLEEQRAKLENPKNEVPTIETPQEPITYNSQRVEDNKALDKVINDHINMYGGERGSALKGELKSALNEYYATGSAESLERVRQITQSLEEIFTDKYYTPKNQRRNANSKKSMAKQDRRIFYPGNRGTITENIERQLASIDSYRNGIADFSESPNESIDNNIMGIAEKMRMANADNEAYYALSMFRDDLTNYQQTGDESYLESALDVFNDLVEKMGPDFYYTVALDFETAFGNVADSATQTEVPTIKNEKAPLVDDSRRLSKTIGDSSSALSETRVPSTQENVNTIPRIMAEDIGLNPNAEEETEVQPIPTLNDVKKSIVGNESQYATNTLRRSEKFFARSKETAEALDKARAEGMFLRDKTSEVESLEAARRMVENNHDGVKNTIMTAPNISNVQIDASAILIDEALSNGDIEEALRMSNAVASKVRDAAQGLQALAKYTRSATGVIMKTAQLNKLAGKDLNMSATDIVEIQRLFDEASKYGENSKKASELHQQAYAIASKYLPDKTFVEKWNSWRYLAMLGNPRTHIRNILGNTAFGFVTNVKDAVGSVMEGAYAKTTGKDIERTKAVVSKVADADLFEGAKNYYNDNAYALATDGGNKYSMENEIKSAQRVFKNDKLEAINNFNSNALTAEDDFAIEKKYVRALAGYLKANGKDASIFDSKNEKDIAFLKRASDYAVKEAKEATFHEDNAFANYLNNMSKQAAKSDSLGVKTMNMVLESVMPFKKTPANILKQGIEYSPLGVIKAFKQIHNNADATTVLNSLAKTATGSMILGIGAFLASKGILRGAQDDDKDDILGEQEYSINVGNHSYTIDWLAPAALPLFVGAELYKASEGETDFFDALTSVAEPVIEMSMLQGLNNALQSIANSYDSGNAAAEILTELGTGYLTQSIPTLSGQIARTIDPMRRTTYTTKNGILGSLQYQAEKVQNKIPFLSMLNDEYVDPWGEEQQNTGGNVLGRAVNNMLLPGYYSNTERNELEGKLEELYDSVDKANIFPDKASRSYNGEKLSSSQYKEFQTEMGKLYTECATTTVNNADFDSLTNEEKVSLLENIKKFSNAVAKANVLRYKIENSSDYKKNYAIYQEKGFEGLSDFLIADAKVKSASGVEKGSIPVLTMVDTLDSLGMSNAEKGDYLMDKLSDPIKPAQRAYESAGSEGFYEAYRIKTLADTNGNGISQTELADYLRQSGMDINKRYEWFDIFYPDAKEIPTLY